MGEYVIYRGCSVYYRLMSKMVVFFKGVQWRTVLSSTVFICSVGGLVGVVFFAYFYGLGILNPGNVQWLLNGNDLEQHYMGWVFYRDAPWSFPLGMMDQLPYPYEIPLTYTDSIPLFAIPFKLLSFLLPETFQYLGLYGLLSFFLQGALGALIVRKFTSNKIAIIIAAIFFVAAPVFVSRMYIHTALASNWLILLGIAAVLYRHAIVKLGVIKEVLVWSSILTLLVLVHPYYLAMTGIFWVAYLVLTFQKQWRRIIPLAVIPPVVMLLVFWIIGGFSLGGSSGAGGLELYGFNLLAPIDSLGWSRLVPAQGLVHGESFNFFGIGAIILMVLAAFIFVKDSLYKSLFNRLKNDKRFIVAGLLFVCLFIASMGTVIRLGSTVLVDISVVVPGFIQGVWGFFRASGRLFWPIFYLLLISALGIVMWSLRRQPRVLIGLLLVVGLVQFFDVTHSPSGHTARFKAACVADCTPTIEASKEERTLVAYIESIIKDDTRIKHVFYISPDGYMEPDDYYMFANVIADNDLTLNNGYFARSPEKKIKESVLKTREEILSGAPLAKDTLYVTNEHEFVDKADEKGRSMHQVGEYYFIF